MAFRTPDAPAEWEAIVASFLRRHVAAAGARGLVVGLSGGLDSAVVAGLASRALGADRVVPVWLPAAESDPKDLADAKSCCKAFGLKLVERPVAGVVDALRKATGTADPAVLGNLTARSRMAVLYAEAQARGMLVCGTGNKSELLSGYFTKHGDGGVDLQPIGDLYKTQVRSLARHVGVPAAVLAKPPSAGLRPGQTDEGDLGVTYDELDAVLKGMELNQDLEAIAKRTGVVLAKVRAVEGRVRGSEHKRRAPLVPKIGARTVGIDWRRSVHWDADA